MPEPRPAVAHWMALYRVPARSQALDRFRIAFGREPERCERDEVEGGYWVGPITPREMVEHRKQRARQLASRKAGLPLAGRSRELTDDGLDPEIP